MKYQEALAYIYSFTDYERGGKFVQRLGEDLQLEKMLMKQLGDPQNDYSSTLIAGTKGKGSTAALIESVLRHAGIRTGLYTQPDLHTFRERSQVSGRLIREQEVADLVPEIQQAVESIQASGDFGPFITYHIGTALAFLYFSRQRIQHAVLEVGLGGRLDATNIVHPLVSVITSISYDHMSILGNTLRQIATEKAGIIRPNGLVVTSAQAPEALLAIEAVAHERHARVVRVGSAHGDPAQSEVDQGLLHPLSYRYAAHTQDQQRQHFTIWTPDRIYENLELSLLGEHQLENATAALATLEQLRMQGIQWNEPDLRQGFREVQWPARLEIVAQNPPIVVDGAHNADSLTKLVSSLRQIFPGRRLIMVIGMNKDKDVSGNIRALASVDAIVLTRMNNARSMSVEELRAFCLEHIPSIPLYQAELSHQALDLARQLAHADNDLICATGSLYLAGEALRWAADHGSVRAASEIERANQ
ncbi:bifunctional folylpolyglutamate synthase/dihydrofolate synthase [Tengunoibacter tsumagoiensis]|uniref:tetrahydrofolate synthase n=1 Tax=Tengunoibacter tsumagoiensis TaxID=2014871 RepID=A0A401ZY45_9CHLR|nr:folylpolyglutamate synthase/dihydrofolate synthase family protein [Tengunoibacter tsumagoiensis]GCE11776.1 bifunctional folylpolyglutamate synthase/dihydrofolate synthase [Tengunoibacter tsumagoiensis]